MADTGTGTTNTILQGQGTGATPKYSTATYPSTTTINQILYSSSGDTVAGLATGNDGVLVTSHTGVPSWLANGSVGQVLTANTNLPPSWATPTTGTVTSVSGTANRITSTGGATPVIDISAAYVGQTSITTLGTITSGTWNASVIGLTYGGTNANLTASNGGIFYSTSTAGAILAGTATAGQMLQSGASAAPTWSTSTYPATNAVSTLLYASSANVMAALATGNDGVLITSHTGVPSWLAGGTTGQVLTATTNSPPTWGAAPGAGLLSVSGTLTNAQVKALHGTPVQVIATPGAGKFIEPVYATMTMDYGGTNVFTAAAAQTIIMTWGTAANPIIKPSVTNAMIVASSSQLTFGPGQYDLAASLTAYTTYANVAMNMYNPVATEITGNAANNNTISYNILYRIITIP